MMTYRIGIVGIGALIASGGCSEQPRTAVPTEQEIHMGGASGRHPYRCDDGRALLVDFRNEGLTIEIRRDRITAPIVMTAPAQGLRYVGDTMSAIFAGDEMKIEEAGERPVRCQKSTSL